MIGDVFLNPCKKIGRKLPGARLLGDSPIGLAGGKDSPSGPIGAPRLMGSTLLDRATPARGPVEMHRRRARQRAKWARSETKCGEWR